MVVYNRQVAVAAVAPLCGPRQTINRGEVTAFLDFLSATTGPAAFVTDSSYVCRGWVRIRADSIPTTNIDLWAAIRTVPKSRPIYVTKIESHLSFEDACTRQGDMRHWVGNTIADALADVVTLAHQVPSDLIADLHAVDNIARAVVFRSTAILRRCLEVDPPPKRLPSTRQTTLTPLRKALSSVFPACRRCVVDSRPPGSGSRPSSSQ